MAKTMTLGGKELSINLERLWASIQELAEIGAYKDEATGLVGVNRLALSAADGEGRRLVSKWFKEAGLDVSVDQIGNVYGRREGERKELAPVLLGSHIDSVPTAGAFDGCLGVLGALEAARILSEAGVRTARPLVVAFFTEEEGCRFGTDMLGSAVATGRIGLEQAYSLRDRDGLDVRGELDSIGFLGAKEAGWLRPHAYLECHIEQGPILRSRDMDIGIVTGVQAISWREVVFAGRPAHAGTTPGRFRRDAGLAASRLNVELREMARSGRYGKHMRATMGFWTVEPGMVNVVPGRVACSVDLRNPSDAMMSKAEGDLEAFLKSLEREENVSISWRQTARTQAVSFDPSVQGLLADTAERLGLRHEPILSGAGHDAQEWSRLCKAAMIFVPGEYEGISHNPREFSSPKQCADGINVLLHAALSLLSED